MSSRIHPQARATPKIRQEIKDSGLSSREAAKVFNITRATAQKWLGRDDVQDRSHRAHTLHTTLSQAQEAIVLALRQSLYLPLDDLLTGAISHGRTHTVQSPEATSVIGQSGLTGRGHGLPLQATRQGRQLGLSVLARQASCPGRKGCRCFFTLPLRVRA
jgi:hypothetical protein